MLRNALLKPQRLTITVPQAVYEQLVKISFRGGRSMSNLAAFLLERAIQDKRLNPLKHRASV
jgi:predicted CopG family antitoxin